MTKRDAYWYITVPFPLQQGFNDFLIVRLQNCLLERKVGRYDNNGNRTSKKTYAYTTGNLGTASSTTNYTYGDSTWGDILTNTGAGTINYDAIGNPIIYFSGNNYIFTWTDGRRLATAETQDGYHYSFTYNDEGIRTSKTVDGVKHTYTLEGTCIISEQWGNNLIIYIYDEAGSPIGMLYRTNSYAADTYDIFYFEKNLQGDIIAIYNASGTKLVGYTYDAWGNCTTTYYNGGGSTAAQYNPFRYRGYYFDSELNFYYLNSRYYDPYTGRFINADDSLYQHILGYNMYAYCVNSPVAYIDPTGQLFIIDDLVTGPIDEIIVVVGIIVVAVIVGVAGTSNDTLANEIINSTSDIFVGIEQQASIIWNVLFDESQDNPLPEEQDIKVDIDHIMDRHHPSSGKSPKKDKFPKWMTPIVIEKIVREAYENARTNYPDSVLKVQEGIRYYIEGFSSNNRIRIWVDTVKKTITTAFPK